METDPNTSISITKIEWCITSYYQITETQYSQRIYTNFRIKIQYNRKRGLNIASIPYAQSECDHAKNTPLVRMPKSK